MIIEVSRPGPLALVQDLGRPGLAHLGVPGSGAADRSSHDLANRLVGNLPEAATAEFVFGGAALRFEGAAWIAVTGAPAPLTVAGRPEPPNTPLHVPAGARVELGVPARGLRTYLAVRGGIAVAPVLGSRSADLLSGLGPAPLRAGDRLPVGDLRGPFPGAGTAPVRDREPVLGILPGPRADWFTPDALTLLTARPYRVSQDSNRVGVRLSGAVIPRARRGEPASEGMALGSVQIPPDGLPIVFLADHPTTGGYPVLGVVRSADLAVAAQARPGQELRFVKCHT
ncbi:biotin-dependent carboxyltransferase family protein [Actinocorallia longicatena]|uniref:Biotin-dependent carboxyltransferase family protein n=1 Tax=Actinocorallia longicatena TaxID=111803 RepID=A0ABP6QJX4_9ACTN